MGAQQRLLYIHYGIIRSALLNAFKCRIKFSQGIDRILAS